MKILVGKSVALALVLAGPASLPVAPVSAQSLGPGPDFETSTECAATYVLTARLVGEGNGGYDNAIKNGTGWLTWANQTADGRDATAVMNQKAAALESSWNGLDNDAYNNAIMGKIQSCMKVQAVSEGNPNFARGFQAASGSSQPPGFNAAVDCGTFAAMHSGILGDDHPDAEKLTVSRDKWFGYAARLHGDASTAQAALKERADQVIAILLDMDEQKAIEEIAGKAANCEAMESRIPQ